MYPAHRNPLGDGCIVEIELRAFTCVNGRTRCRADLLAIPVMVFFETVAIALHNGYRGTAVASEARAEVAEPLCLQIQQYALDFGLRHFLLIP